MCRVVDAIRQADVDQALYALIIADGGPSASSEALAVRRLMDSPPRGCAVVDRGRLVGSSALGWVRGHDWVDALPRLAVTVARLKEFEAQLATARTRSVLPTADFIGDSDGETPRMVVEKFAKLERIDEAQMCDAPTPNPTASPATVSYLNPGVLDRIPGWFAPVDISVFQLFLSSQCAELPGGHILELGAYLGKSATLLGHYLRAGETLTVVDLFGMSVEDAHLGKENGTYYSGLTRSSFEENYLSIHRNLPHIVQSLTSHATARLPRGSYRFIHIDASHLYEFCAEDIRSSRDLAQHGAIIALDDFRNAHTPGVAAACWEAVANGLVPLVLTDTKMYASWTPDRDWVSGIARVASESEVRHEVTPIHGHQVLRIG
ncbi:MAG: class I SAM-dependent methyltransferase [Austwickia sp.]|nr:class I SAM-dependent methyltransferase [Austwickia sp.]